MEGDRPGDVTVLIARGRRLTKLIHEGGIVDFDCSLTFFEVEAFRLHGIDDLAELITRLSVCPDRCVIRARLARPMVGEVRRFSAASHGEAVTFVEEPRSWLVVDLEHIACPPWLDPTDPLLVGGYLRRLLPMPFQMARCVTQLSSGAGLKKGLRCHLWFWTDRALVRDEIRRLLGGVQGVDMQVYVPVQPNYCANPVFVGVADPIYERIAVLPGYDEVAVPDLPAPRPRQAFGPVELRPYAPPRRGLFFKPTRAERYMLKCLRSVAEAPVGRRHPTIVGVAACLYGLAKGGALDPRDLEARILGAVQLSTFDRDIEEVYSALRWAWEHAQPWRLP